MSCLSSPDARVDAVVESHNSSCFGGCHKPLNRSGDCYMECYEQTIQAGKMSAAQLTESWARAFAEDEPPRGCPPL